MRIDGRFVALFFALCALLSAPARAQQPLGDLYTVAGVRVDETAADARQARATAFARAQTIAFERLARRLAAAESRAAPPRIEGAALDRMVIGLDLEDERRSGTRYIASVAVRFDPAQVRAALQGAGLQLTETRAPAVLVVPVGVQAAGGFGEQPDNEAWRAAWRGGGFEHELAPLLTGAPAMASTPDWPQVQPVAYQVGASTALFATLRQDGRTLAADLVEVGPNGQREDRGSVATALPSGSESLPDAYRRLADAVNARLQADWKARAARSIDTVRNRMSTSVLYANQGEWTRIKQALERLAKGAVSEIQIEAIASDGALVSFAYSGPTDRIVQEFRRQGLLLAESAQGLTVRVAAP